MSVIAELATNEWGIVVAIVLARLLVPLLIPRVPLVILVCLVLDAADNSLLARFTEVDLGPGGPYQSFDKALDIYYLSIAYLATMRNWTSVPAFRVSQFLFYYRLLGVFLFEALDSRAMLLIFPNTFEYFFIVVEVIRLRFDPARFSLRFWLLLAAGIWVFVKLPQEWWIHVHQGDFTDAIVDSPIIGVVAALVVVGLLALVLLVVRPRMPAPDWGFRLIAEPLPDQADAETRAARRLRRTQLHWGELAEKAGLLALLSVIFATILSDVTATGLEVAIAAIAIVCANTAISLAYARSARVTVEAAAARFATLLAANVVLVYVASHLIEDSGDFPLGEGLFFAFLVTLILWLYDAYRPVYEGRHASPSAPARPRLAVT